MDLKHIKNNFLVYGVAIPIVVCIILIVVSYLFVPTFIKWLPTDKDDTNAVVQFDKKEYYLVGYNKFDELRLNNFIGWLSSSDLSMGTAITYNSEKEINSAVSMIPGSQEPWNGNGPMLIIGENKDSEFRNLHNAQIGNRVTIDFNGHESCTYEITEIYIKENREEVNRHLGNGTLVMCMQYNDFRNLNEAYQYRTVVAKRVMG